MGQLDRPQLTPSRYIGAVELSNVPLEDQRLVFMGAGSAGVGVAKQMVEYYTRRGMSEAEASELMRLLQLARDNLTCETH